MGKDMKTAPANDRQERETTVENLRDMVKAGLKNRPEGCRKTLQEELAYYEMSDPEYAEELKALLEISE